MIPCGVTSWKKLRLARLLGPIGIRYSVIKLQLCSVCSLLVRDRPRGGGGGEAARAQRWRGRFGAINNAAVHYYSSRMRQRSGWPRLTARVLLRLNNPIIILITQRPPSPRSPTTILCQISSNWNNNWTQSSCSIYTALFPTDNCSALLEREQCVCTKE